MAGWTHRQTVELTRHTGIDVKTITTGGKKQKLFKILGEGDLDVAGCLKTLRKLKYQRIVALEYEENPKNPLSDLEICLKTVRTAIKSLG